MTMQTDIYDLKNSKVGTLELPDNFFGGGTFTGNLWSPGNQIPVPPTPIMHHANWTIVVVSKMEQLRRVKDAVMSRSRVKVC